MREYLIGSIMIWLVALAAWYLLVDPFAQSHDQVSTLAALTIDQRHAKCSENMSILMSMSDDLLRAGGPEMSAGLRGGVEDCLAADTGIRMQLKKSPLIRLFPGT
jgi:hypothetical protein